ncbi:hypothetical protein N7471_002159 [Penicillium samsonianum]|uniref:uncharacterized protein n=1 Tax=Penicillium samsonianum TaxID=1882272 RepID=UPI00254853A0|nr:uncharacterized protein N7471_002159 [Penicillium samsonianum]KAJ6142706.1 hypothetical protein N7471_002159 [Penicillium samsonianum]
MFNDSGMQSSPQVEAMHYVIIIVRIDSFKLASEDGVPGDFLGMLPVSVPLEIDLLEHFAQDALVETIWGVPSRGHDVKLAAQTFSLSPVGTAFGFSCLGVEDKVAIHTHLWWS